MTVYLVGAGPGDPELITLRGARLLATADVVVFDRLAAGVVTLAGAGAQLVDVGKAPGAAPVPQSEINRLLVEHGRRHNTVVRLKGGDPFVFARGAEEAEALLDAGVPFEIVPGVSSALAAPAAAGVPLTLRDQVRSFTVLTGHEDPDLVPRQTWESLARLGGTLVVLMGAARMGATARCLLDAGLPPDTPVVAIRAATTPEQQVVRCRLADLGTVGVASPATFVIGEVAALRLEPPPAER
ncbi:MAG TPA: uroporphyrinogen-III C-methyltransferase [Acidimicrobiales bacterium]|nr:uroporphyrinogen-III C-methyltransferase [Acidimicrobiales bacterium]